MASLNGINYYHTFDAFTKGVDESGGPSYKVQYYINDYDDTDSFIGALVGQSTRSGGVGGSTVRNSPHRHPLAPLLVCKAANLVQGLGNAILNANGFPYYDGGALVEARYGPVTFDFGPILTQNSLENSIDPTTPVLWATQEIDHSSESIYRDSTSTFPKYASGPNTGEVPSGSFRYQIPITYLTLTFHQMPYIPMTVTRSLRGKVNSDTFLGATPGCVRFAGAKTTREFNNDGSVVQKVQLSFEERSPLHKWNWMPGKDTFTWYLVDADGSGSGATMYDTAAFSPLLSI